MNYFTEPMVSFRDFKRALNLRCYKTFGCSYSDLPDVVNLHDFWYDGIQEKEAVMMLDGVMEDLALEVGFNLAGSA